VIILSSFCTFCLLERFEERLDAAGHDFELCPCERSRSEPLQQKAPVKDWRPFVMRGFIGHLGDANDTPRITDLSAKNHN